MPACDATYREIADSLLERSRHDARLNELGEPFMAGLPVPAPGMSHAWTGLQRRAMLCGEGQRRIALMARHEGLSRAFFGRLERML